MFILIRIGASVCSHVSNSIFETRDGQVQTLQWRHHLVLCLTSHEMRNRPQKISPTVKVYFFYSALRNLYAHCIQSPEGQHVGCITDLMGDGSYLTVPVYATICSAMCYESKENMERVKKCPYPGYRKHDPILSKLFKKKQCCFIMVIFQSLIRAFSVKINGTI